MNGKNVKKTETHDQATNAEQDTQEGQRATAGMRSLISGETLTCHLNGRSSYDRKIGSCRLSDGRDLAAVMMADGLCHRFW